MRKNHYTAPSMECISLNQTTSILAGSSINVLTGVVLDEAQEGSGLNADAPMFDDLDMIIVR